MNAVMTDKAPQAIGPYAQAIVSDGWVFCSGQIPINPISGAIEAADTAGQTMQALLNLRAVLEAAGSKLDRIVKTTVFMTDLGDFPAMNRVYAEMFNGHAPARSTVQVTRLPRGAKVEIEAIARVNGETSASSPPENA